jgi:hypothetical protein
LLHEQERWPNIAHTGLVGGRLLIYRPDATFADALAHDETFGFFDKWDAPPWDTWVWYEDQASFVGCSVVEGYLVCWIPDVFEELAEAGIEAQPYGAIVWADQAEAPFLSQLRKAKLMD